MRKLYLDTEAPLAAGIEPYSIQAAVGADSPTILNPYNWKQMGRLRGLLYDPDTVLVAYNAPFDIHKLYILYHALDFGGRDALRHRDQVIPPFRCRTLDLMIHVKRHPWLCAFAAKKAMCVLRRVPKKHADMVTENLARELAGKFPFPIALNRKVSAVKGSKTLVDLTFSLKGGIGLKAVIGLITGKTELTKVGEAIELAGFAEDTFLPTVPKDLEEFYDGLWERNHTALMDDESLAAEYASNDIEYLKILDAWLGNPTPDCHDTSAGIVAYSRYVGFPFDRQGLQGEADSLSRKCREFEAQAKASEFDPQSPKSRCAWLNSIMPDDCPKITKSNVETLKALLAEGLVSLAHKSTVEGLIKYKGWCQRLKQVEYLLKSETDRAHFELDPWGTSSGRMAGRGKFNAQGISKDSPIRRFLKISYMGDFEGLEVAVAGAILEDERLSKDLADGVNVHLRFACGCWPGMPSYEEALQILEDKEHSRHKEIKDRRSAIKSVVFARLYFCTDHLVATKLGMPIEQVVSEINPKFFGVYPGFKTFRETLETLVCTADKITWQHDSVSRMPAGLTNLLGETRCCLFEKAVAEVLWQSSDRIAKGADRSEKETIRNAAKGKQTEYQAIRSACLGAAINIQNSAFRSLGNFLIQSVGSTLNKTKDALLWQQLGIPLLNVHDEIVVPDGYQATYHDACIVIERFLAEYRKVVPSLRLTLDLARNWAEK